MGPALSADTLLDGALTLFQEKRGYRFTLDSVLLAHFAEIGEAASLLDLGCGCGILPLLLAHLHPGLRRVAGVELQPPLARLAARNTAENGLAHRVTIHRADMRRCIAPYDGGPFAVVVSNPPYTPLGRGRLNPSDQKALARHEVALSLPELLAAARINVAPGGTFHMVYPSDRLDEAMAACARFDLHPHRLRTVHPRAGAPPKRVLISCRTTPSSLFTLPPLVVHDADGSFTDEVDKMFKK